MMKLEQRGEKERVGFFFLPLVRNFALLYKTSTCYAVYEYFSFLKEEVLTKLTTFVLCEEDFFCWLNVNS